MQDRELPVVGHWIGGHATQSQGEYRSRQIIDPATEEPVGVVHFANEDTVARAVDAAGTAAAGWADWTASQRTGLFFSIRDALRSSIDQLAAIVTREHGKTLDDARGELERGIEIIEACCAIGPLSEGRYSRNVSRDTDVLASRYPVGVVAGVTPYNFPAMVPIWMWAPALASGNTFVLKPSERDPSPSIVMARLLKEAGLPDGVFNVIQGDNTAVSALIADPRVSAVSFVGSTNVAKQVYREATSLGKRCQALGGAKNHLLIMDDADLHVAADAAVSAAFGSAGERCMAISVVVALERVADRVIELICERMGSLSVGPGSDPGSDIGPLISAEHRQRVCGFLESATSEGASVVVDGRARVGVPSRGYFLGPCLIDHVRPGMSCYEEEIFGPVLGVVRVKTYEEAIKVINGHRYGNGASVFTESGVVARRFQTDVETGMIGINIPIPVPIASHSFGGWKQSLFGDFGVYGQSGFDFYTRLKTVTTRWSTTGKGVTREQDLAFPSTKP